MAKETQTKNVEAPLKADGAPINAQFGQNEQDGELSPNAKRLNFLIQERDKAFRVFNNQRELYLKYQGAVELLVGIMKEDGEIVEGPAEEAIAGVEGGDTSSKKE